MEGKSEAWCPLISRSDTFREPAFGLLNPLAFGVLNLLAFGPGTQAPRREVPEEV